MNYVSEEAAQEAELRYNAEGSTDSNTESETFVYTLNGREIMLHIKLEDYIQDGVISFGELIRDFLRRVNSRLGLFFSRLRL